MFKTREMILAAVGVLTLFAAANIAAQKTDKAVPKQQRTLALGEDEVKQLLLLMDADKNGMISRAEFLKFMGAEFDRLDKDKSGQLDVNELKQSQLRPAPAAVGK